MEARVHGPRVRPGRASPREQTIAADHFPHGLSGPGGVRHRAAVAAPLQRAVRCPGLDHRRDHRLVFGHATAPGAVVGTAFGPDRPPAGAAGEQRRFRAGLCTVRAGRRPGSEPRHGPHGAGGVADFCGRVRGQHRGGLRLHRGHHPAGETLARHGAYRHGLWAGLHPGAGAGGVQCPCVRTGGSRVGGSGALRRQLRPGLFHPGGEPTARHGARPAATAVEPDDPHPAPAAPGRAGGVVFPGHVLLRHVRDHTAAAAGLAGVSPG